MYKLYIYISYIMIIWYMIYIMICDIYMIYIVHTKFFYLSLDFLTLILSIIFLITEKV